MPRSLLRSSLAFGGDRHDGSVSSVVHPAGTRLTHHVATIVAMEDHAPFLVVAASHPSVDDAVRDFCSSLRAETRYFGRRGAAAPKPTPSLVRRLESSEPAIALAAFVDGEIIGLARIDETASDGPELLIAVARPWRGQGVALALGLAIVARAHGAGVPRVVLRTSVCGTDVRELGNGLGFHVVDLGRGRLDLVRILEPVGRTA